LKCAAQGDEREGIVMHNAKISDLRVRQPSAAALRAPRVLGAPQDPSGPRRVNAPRDLESLRELNLRFLELDWTRAAFGGRIAALTRTQRAVMADCPYALFDLRLADYEYWQLRLQDASPWHVADCAPIGADHAEFMGLALFFAWYSASAAKLSAKLALCMHERTAAALGAVTVNRIPDLVATESAALSARWSHCVPFWSALALSAASGDAQRLKRVQLSGIQLAAATHLPLRREPRAV
jgi:hypothetical protein